MKAHVVENGVVTNTVIVDSLSDMPHLVEATAGGVGWTYDGTSFTDPNAFTQAELDEIKAAANRSKRDSLLTESDWTQIADAPVDASAWTTYRQALRDITSHANWPNLNDEDWPTKPS